MAERKVTSMVANRGGKIKREAYNKNITRTAAAITIHTTILVAVVIMLIPASDAFVDDWNYGPEKKVVVHNNHTNFLSVRCFNFYKSERVRHLDGNKSFDFSFPTNSVFPSSTMYNCSTNMGVFVAYRYDYDCARKFGLCEWRFDLNQTYLLDRTQGTWSAYDYNPNYESLEKGGVVEAKYTNRR